VASSLSGTVPPSVLNCVWASSIAPYANQSISRPPARIITPRSVSTSCTTVTTPSSERTKKQASAVIAPSPAVKPASQPWTTLSSAMTAFIGPGGAARANPKTMPAPNVVAVPARAIDGGL